MKRGDVNKMSFGFSVNKDGDKWDEDDKGTVTRELLDVSLFDVSPVTYPAYTQTSVAIRSLEDGLALSQAGGKPLLVCVNNDGEPASEALARGRYRDPAEYAPWE